MNGSPVGIEKYERDRQSASRITPIDTAAWNIMEQFWYPDLSPVDRIMIIIRTNYTDIQELICTHNTTRNYLRK